MKALFGQMEILSKTCRRRTSRRKNTRPKGCAVCRQMLATAARSVAFCRGCGKERLEAIAALMLYPSLVPGLSA